MVHHVEDLDFHLPSHAQDMLDGLQRLRTQPKLADVTLLVGGQELPCHRGLLALSSPYFHAMFAGDFAESFSARVELRDVEAAMVGQLVDFVYTGRLTITQGNVEALTRTAARLHFPAVQQVCGRYLQQQLDVLLALPRRLEEVLVVVGGRALEEDEEAGEDLPPRPGNFAFYNTKARRWMALPDFPDYHKWGFSLAALNNVIYVTGGSRGSQTDTWSTTQTWCFPLQEAAWRPVAPMLKARTNHASAALHGEIYVIGGTALDVVEVERYDPFTDSWTPVSPALKYVSNFSAAGCQGRLYLVGSSACKYNALALQCYNPTTDTWSVIASPFLPKYLSSPRCADLHGALYLVGDNTKKVYVYDPGANLWRKVQPLHSLHENGALVPLGDALYVTGGRWQGMDGDYHVEMEAYDGARDAWTRRGALPRLWLYHGASAVYLDVARWTQPFGGVPPH
ncbi:kelch-like protein 30 [Echinops telfairi]|uniref:Kelch-like protein 30 n=1 Tax=Echinops telfairi TaxID=9371 RepID=A0AC55DF61_ECHTE|nr:kelch-like protein 30 [Echinops telfairi]